MMFSCCCGKAGWTWTPICDCANSKNQCLMSCMHARSQFADSYYNLANVSIKKNLSPQLIFISRQSIWPFELGTHRPPLSG